MNIAESPAIDKHPHTTVDSDSSSRLPRNRLTCTKKASEPRGSASKTESLVVIDQLTTDISSIWRNSPNMKGQPTLSTAAHPYHMDHVERNSVWLRDEFQTLQTDVTRGAIAIKFLDVANRKYVNELGLVNSAVNGITVEQQQMPTGNSAAGINQMSRNWVWSTQLLMKHRYNSCDSGNAIAKGNII
ncbi:hypothetical protein F511_39105 [Dorcoceras hygrometricum]|uniref:Uncharacterized protein n=1 Tax=Dorcoceras hygrometricum TaxID=472368 RepID=A0A2Z7CQD3_9LAMI|nr:hypothetical protein F511_39105 [Dorcoceras hygrometricum]